MIYDIQMFLYWFLQISSFFPLCIAASPIVAGLLPTWGTPPLAPASPGLTHAPEAELRGPPHRLYYLAGDSGISILVQVTLPPSRPTTPRAHPVAPRTPVAEAQPLSYPGPECGGAAASHRAWAGAARGGGARVSRPRPQRQRHGLVFVGGARPGAGKVRRQLPVRQGCVVRRRQPEFRLRTLRAWDRLHGLQSR